MAFDIKNFNPQYPIIPCTAVATQDDNHYIYISEQFYEDMKGTGIHINFVEAFIQTLEQRPDPFRYGDCIRNSNLFKKERDRTYRFLFQKETSIIDGITFVCLRNILLGHASYSAHINGYSFAQIN